MYKRLDEFKGVALELHHGFTMQGQPWWLGHGLSHLLGNSQTCDGCRLPLVLHLCVSGSLMNGCGGRRRQGL
jgi:hypothetical protein